METVHGRAWHRLFGHEPDRGRGILHRAGLLLAGRDHAASCRKRGSRRGQALARPPRERRHARCGGQASGCHARALPRPGRGQLAGRARLPLPVGARRYHPRHADRHQAGGRPARADEPRRAGAGGTAGNGLRPANATRTGRGILGYTIAEKILARAAGRDTVKAGDEVMAKPDFVLAYDFPGYTDVYFKQMEEEFGIDKVAEPERFGIFIDHMVPVASPKEEELHKGTRAWCEKNDVALYERKGIGHQVAAEVGYATPGAFVVHFDGHISQLGTFGTLAIGLRRNVLEAFVREKVSIKVPETVRVNLHGSLRPGVMARDVFHHIVRVLGPSSCRFQVLELGGDGLEDLTTEGIQSITCLAMFTGALTAIVNPNQGRLDYALPRAKKELEPVYSDPDASYAATHDIDLSELEPVVVIPPTPANTRNLSEFVGLDVQSGYLGSCASGRLEDIEIA